MYVLRLWFPLSDCLPAHSLASAYTAPCYCSPSPRLLLRLLRLRGTRARRSLPCPWLPPACALCTQAVSPVPNSCASHTSPPPSAFAFPTSAVHRIVLPGFCARRCRESRLHPHYRLLLPSRPLPADLISPARPIHAKPNPRLFLCGATWRPPYCARPTTSSTVSAVGTAGAASRCHMQRCPRPGCTSKPPPCPHSLWYLSLSLGSLASGPSWCSVST